jgi:uncharacterized protein (TIGR02147 family)
MKQELTRPQGTDFRLFLQEELLRRCRANPSYSLRAFAKSLGTDFSSLSKILKGKRPLGPRAIRNLGKRLGLGPAELQRYLGGLKRSHNAITGSETTLIEADTDYGQLALDSFQIISDWQHYAILELMRVDQFRSEEKWIARALGITVSEAHITLERLERVGLIEKTAEGWVDISGGKSTTVHNEFTATAFRSLQRQILERALVALEEVPMEKRDQSSMTMAIDTDRLPEAKEMIKDFRRKLAKFLSRGERRDQVYNLGISLYPVSKIEGELQ